MFKGVACLWMIAVNKTAGCKITLSLFPSSMTAYNNLSFNNFKTILSHLLIKNKIHLDHKAWHFINIYPKCTVCLEAGLAGSWLTSNFCAGGRRPRCHAAFTLMSSRVALPQQPKNTGHTWSLLIPVPCSLILDSFPAGILPMVLQHASNQKSSDDLQALRDLAPANFAGFKLRSKTASALPSFPLGIPCSGWQGGRWKTAEDFSSSPENHHGQQDSKNINLLFLFSGLCFQSALWDQHAIVYFPPLDVFWIILPIIFSMKINGSWSPQSNFTSLSL